MVRAAGPPQRAAEERGAGMPRRRRRDLAAVMANRRPQRDAVDHGKHFDYLRFISQCCQYILLQGFLRQYISFNAIRYHDFSSVQSAAYFKDVLFYVYAVRLYLYLLHVVIVLLISEEEREDEEEAEQLSSQPTAKIGAKKQKKLEEKQARKAQREVRGYKQFRTRTEKYY